MFQMEYVWVQEFNRNHSKGRRRKYCDSKVAVFPDIPRLRYHIFLLCRRACHKRLYSPKITKLRRCYNLTEEVSLIQRRNRPTGLSG